MSLRDTALQLAELCEQKRAAYGDSIPKAAAALAAIYPTGIPVDQYINALVFARISEKHARVAAGAEKHGEHPLMDAAGYGLMGWDYTREAEQTCQGSASGRDATEPQKAQLDSAPRLTNAPITTSAVPNNVPTSSLKPSASSVSTSSASRAYACAHAAMEAASGREAVLAAARASNEADACAWCGDPLERVRERFAVTIGESFAAWSYVTDSPNCTNLLQEALA